MSNDGSFINSPPHVLINIAQIKSTIQSNANNTLLIGLTGGIATGKTTVAEMFGREGAEIIDFDLLAREAVEPGTKGLADIVASFGSGILDKSGYLNRKALSQIVFEDTEKRRLLERLIHPAILELFCHKVGCKMVEKISSEKGKTAIIAVIPLLIEMNLQSLFDKLILVHVSSEIQLERLMLREHIDRKRASAMVKSQMPIDEKKEYANFMIDNSNDLENTLKQVKYVWKNL